MILIEPQEIELEGQTFIISKFPAIQGREIIAGYPLTGLPKIGDYKQNEEIMLKLMSFVAKPLEGRDQPLTLGNRELINNHVKSWEILMKLELRMLEYNCSFFQNGRVSTFFADIAQKAPAWITKMLTGLLVQLSQLAKQPSTNSEQSTP